mmetsp:Transcript_12989/g.24712  ORF Transcript_12989/g.24712 Transcript_12989/m.24712 type:complete len:513 (-) Transcript_12989:694-2232(-)
MRAPPLFPLLVQLQIQQIMVTGHPKPQAQPIPRNSYGTPTLTNPPERNIILMASRRRGPDPLNSHPKKILPKHPPPQPPPMAPTNEPPPQSTKKLTNLPNRANRKRKKLSNDPSSSTPYNSKTEAIAAFKGLLLAKDIAPTTKWNDVVRICADDARWEACTTLGERKQALAEYQTKRANELRDVKRQEKVRAKEAYQRLLNDMLPTAKGFTPGTSRFMDVRDSLAKDDRFYAVDDETAREELFYDFVEELRKREERTKRNKKREAKEAFLAFLKVREEDGKLTFASTWPSFLSSLDETERNDSRFSVSPNLSDSDRQLYFADYVIELQTIEDEKRRRIRDARRRAEKAQRDAYRILLRTMAEAGSILPSTRWRSVEEKVASDPSFEPVQAQGREVPRELFDDFVREWNDEYRRDRATLNRVLSLSKTDFKVDDSTTMDDFTNKLLDLSGPSPDLYGEVRRILNRENPLSSTRLFFDELRAEKVVVLKKDDESSEDEGEIVEEGEVEETKKAT